MGRKKKFIDKKKSATFQLLARDSSDPNYADEPGGDRIFIRVDNNPVSINSFGDGDDDDDDGNDEHRNEDSIFADAPEDDDDSGEEYKRVLGSSSNGKAALPEHVRKEILELGFPDDGYNYLIHLREIKNTGGGSAFYHNPKFRHNELPRDVKAFDASRLQISEVKGDPNEKSIYSVAERTVTVRMQRAVDPEVAALLDDSDLSRFGSDVEDLEEDFVVQANFPEEGEDLHNDKNFDLVEERDVINTVSVSGNGRIVNEEMNQQVEERPRVRRLLDDQFDMLELEEYGPDDDEQFDDDGYTAEGEELLANRLNTVLGKRALDEMELDEKYRTPADLLRGNLKVTPESEILLDGAADVIEHCFKYAEKYEIEGEDEKVVILEESSDESEQWDCETIVSTYSNLDNHPAKIEAPAMARKKMLAETVSEAVNSATSTISLRGREKLPVDFLPHRKPATEKVKGVGGMKTELPKRKPHGQETKEEKKERKAAVKEERREARQKKKELKEVYRYEAHRAQKAAAITGPSSIHLM